MLSSSKSLSVDLRYNIVGKREEVLIEFRLINMPRKDKVPFNPSLCKNCIPGYYNKCIINVLTPP